MTALFSSGACWTPKREPTCRRRWTRWRCSCPTTSAAPSSGGRARPRGWGGAPPPRGMSPPKPARLTRGDHIKEWWRGGETNLANGRLLCLYHDRLRQDGWELTRVTDPDDGKVGWVLSAPPIRQTRAPASVVTCQAPSLAMR